MKPKMGIILPTGFKMDLPKDSPYEEIERIALLAEELRFDYIFSYDHLLTAPDPTYRILEPWTVLSALARETKRIRFGRRDSANQNRKASIHTVSGRTSVVGIWYETEDRSNSPDGIQDGSPPKFPIRGDCEDCLVSRAVGLSLFLVV